MDLPFSLQVIGILVPPGPTVELLMVNLNDVWLLESRYVRVALRVDCEYSRAADWTSSQVGHVFYLYVVGET